MGGDARRQGRRLDGHPSDGQVFEPDCLLSLPRGYGHLVGRLLRDRLDQEDPSASYSRRKPSNSRLWPSSSRRMSMTMS